MEGCALVIIGIIAVVVIINYENQKSAKSALQRLEQARSAYFDSLSKLKQHPSDPDIRQETLRLGRDYCGLSRAQKAVTIYDEMALMNDIGAACAAVAHTAQVATHQTTTVAERLSRLEDLRAGGLITEAEHATRRREILNEL